MSITEAIKAEVRKNKNHVFRRAYIRRMDPSGVFETNWQEISRYVKRFGKVVQSVDTDRYARLNFRSNTIVVNNEDGKFLDESDNRSLWYGYATQQRTLVKIVAGFENPSLGADGIWRRDTAASTAFMGILSGDMPLSAQYEVNLICMPLMEVFRTFPASQLTGFTSTGMTASQFCALLRDQTDGAGSFVFRPFFGDTTSNWSIEATTNVYGQLNTNASADLINSSAWDVLQKLAEAEDKLAYINSDGQFIFASRPSNVPSNVFEFYGLGIHNREFGHTIKKINSFGRKFSKYYSRVSVQYSQEATTSSYEIVESSLTVNGTNLPWIYGHKTFELQNFWIPGATLAASIAQNIFDNVTSIRREIEFTTCFIPGLNALDQISLNYDPAKALPESLWDLNNWQDTTTGFESGGLVWDASRGDSFYLNQEEMNIISVETDLDKMENKIIARET